MDEKQTLAGHANRVTLDELAGMIQRSVAHKTDLDKQTAHIEHYIRERHHELVELIKKIPTRDELEDYRTLQKQMADVRRVLHEKLNVEV